MHRTVQTAPPPQAQVRYSPPVTKKNNTAVIVGASAAVILLVAVGIYAKSTGLFHAAENVVPPASPLVAAPQGSISAPPLAQAPNTNISAPPLAQAANTQLPGPPQAILNYLAFVQQIEQQRNALEAEETAAILPLLGVAQGMKTDMDDDDNAKQNDLGKINDGMTDNLQHWQALIKQFNSVAPPQGCDELGNDYYKFLQAYTDLASQIQVALAKGDVAKVLGLQSAQNILNQDASNADGALASVCTKYNAKKTFVITTGDTGSGTSLLGG
jgi:hypothetical protein